ncbi:hypothetical protein F5148DRAFT_1151971 [Russula earlei]|uniref:Uncharacterized protein n=1 Tax=Russula earlei TaxID=71964 RepID=A0ACC0TYH1_9AGAM|nr:hypothetical protein F5148DRAFT_1151971 [Russula earlei]
MEGKRNFSDLSVSCPAKWFNSSCGLERLHMFVVLKTKDVPKDQAEGGIHPFRGVCNACFFGQALVASAFDISPGLLECPLDIKSRNQPYDLTRAFPGALQNQGHVQKKLDPFGRSTVRDGDVFTRFSTLVRSNPGILNDSARAQDIIIPSLLRRYPAYLHALMDRHAIAIVGVKLALPEFVASQSGARDLVFTAWNMLDRDLDESSTSMSIS